MKLDPSLNFIAEVTIGPLVAYTFVFVGLITPNRSPLVEYLFPNFVLRLSFDPIVLVVLTDFKRISVLPIAPAARFNFLHSIVLLVPPSTNLNIFTFRLKVSGPWGQLKLFCFHSLDPKSM